MLYLKNLDSELSKQLFKNPTAEYRGTPFWAWNCKLNKEQLIKQIDQLKEMGMGGAHIHCRTGMATEYLGKEFMELVKACSDKFKEEEMLCWLYDEDRWPSGAAGGIVTKEEKYRARYLVFEPKVLRKESSQYSGNGNKEWKALQKDNRLLLGTYEVVLKNGCLEYYKKLEEDEKSSRGGKVWEAYLEIAGDNPWFNNQAYVNTLDRNAIQKFVEVTHELYYRELGQEFGKSIPGIFTDEPQFRHKENFGFAEEDTKVALPYTDDFDETYFKSYGESLLVKLPELFWELPMGEVSVTRYRYHDHISERFSEAFSDTIGEWCDKHGIMLTGHMMEEPTLASQTRALGEAMRSYRSFQLPGIDMLCDYREFTTAKQAQSASAQYGREGVLSELYGVTNWDFDFRGHKLAGDWQAALGVTVRVHHLTWVSMEGEAKRDYPASIGYQSPWYREYGMIEDHFSRLNTALTRGKAKVKVGVIHPVESYWLHFGPMEQTSTIRAELEDNFRNITEWLLYGLVDFHYISEALLPELSEMNENKKLKVGEMEYDVILVPGNETLRSSTVDRLEAMKRAGGDVIFLGEPPKLMDAMKSERVIRLSEACTKIPFVKTKLLQLLEDYRDIDIRTTDGSRSDNLFYQIRQDGDKNWLFICHVNKMKNPDIASIEKVNISIKGTWSPILYDTMTGNIEQISAQLKENKTIIQYEFSQHDSLLLCLEPGIPQQYCVSKKADPLYKELTLEDPCEVTLSEPNALLLDMAEYCFDDGEWMDREELLRIDTRLRESLRMPVRLDAMAQPWVNTKEEPFEHKLLLKFIIDSEIEIGSPELALENIENTTITVNGKIVQAEVIGWYVDECIKRVKLPALPSGKSELILEIKFNSKTNVEWCYLLGDFGVEVKGSHAKIIKPFRKMAFGDWVNQGLPFYAGNVTYHCEFSCNSGSLKIEIPQFRNPLLSLALDDKKIGAIAFAPYSINTWVEQSGIHRLDITSYGNRINAFGTIHNCDNKTEWFGPNAWRTEGSSWAYEYQLKSMGILTKPILKLVNR